MMLEFFKKKNRANLPECWKEYLDHFNTKKNINVPIDECTFTVLDVESNGFNPKEDKILSIGAVKIKNNQIDVSNTLEIFLDQEEFNPDTVPIHGIRKNTDYIKESEQIAMRKLVKYIGDDVIVGHSITFDIGIINETLKKYVADKLKNYTIDTVSLYTRFKGGDFKIGTTTSLDFLSDEFNIPKSDRHNAAGDALITAILFMKLVSRLNHRGVKNLKDLLKDRKVLI